MNNWSGVGRLTKDPDVRSTSGAEPKTVARFTVAIDDGYGDNKRTNFIPVVCFGRTADNVERFLGKGSQVGIVGKIQTGSYEKDGRKVYTTDVIADRVEFIGSKSDREQSAEVPSGFRAVDEEIPF